jgi:P27 family predicted phage terminase small subunit
MPGPRKKPTSELHSWRAQLDERKNEIQVEKPRRPPACPKWLTGKAKDYWRDLSKGQHSAGLLTAIDVLAFGAICTLAADADAYAEEVGENFLVTWVCGDSTSERLNPLLKHRLETIKVMAKICNDMAMTPTARIGLPQPETPEKKKGEVINGKNRFPKG